MTADTSHLDIIDLIVGAQPELERIADWLAACFAAPVIAERS